MDKKFNQVYENLDDDCLFDSSSSSTSFLNSPNSQGGPFIQKLGEILEDRSNSTIVSWNRAGTSVIIRDIVAFSQNVLPKHGFKTTTFNSFVRQLNMYDFHKVKHGTLKGRRGENKYLEFKNENFIRDKPHLRANIKRKSNEKDNEIHVIYCSLQESFNQLFKYTKNLKQKLEEIDRDNQILKKMIEKLKNYTDKRFDDISGKAPNNSLNDIDNNKYPESKTTSPPLNENHTTTHSSTVKTVKNSNDSINAAIKAYSPLASVIKDGDDDDYIDRLNPVGIFSPVVTVDDGERKLQPSGKVNNGLGNNELYSPSISDISEDIPLNPIEFDYYEGLLD